MISDKTLETKAHSETSMNASDVQVSDEDGVSETDTIRRHPQHDDQSEQQDCERANLNARFPVSPARL